MRTSLKLTLRLKELSIDRGMSRMLGKLWNKGKLEEETMDHYFNSVGKEHLHLTLTLDRRSITKREIFVQDSRDGKRE